MMNMESCMKVTDENVIKNGEKELLETIVGGLDLNTIKEKFNNKYRLVIRDDVEFQKGNIVVHNNSVAFRLNFDAKINLSMLLDINGDCIEISTLEVKEKSSPEKTYEPEAIDLTVEKSAEAIQESEIDFLNIENILEENNDENTASSLNKYDMPLNNSSEKFYDRVRQEPKRKKRVKPQLIIFLIFLLSGGLLFGARTMGIQNPFSNKNSDLSGVKSSTSHFHVPKVENLENYDISVIDVKGKFVSNATTGKLFVLTGNAKDEQANTDNLIKIIGKLYSKDNKIERIETVFCGNILSDTELVNLDMDSIKKSLARRPKKNAENPNVTVPFMLVFNNLPHDIGEYEIVAEPLASSQAG